MSSSTVLIYVVMPCETAKIRAMPMIPILPANEVSAVLPFFVNRFFSDSPNDVANDIDGSFFLSVLDFSFRCSRLTSSCVSGAKSSVISPSSMRIIRVEYFSARSGLCVTITTSRSLAISFKISMT